MLTLNTNYYALIAQSNFNKAYAEFGQALTRLSSGKRINSAKDDPAGMAIANRMRANISGLQQGARNANDGISIAQTAEGALDEINENLLRIRVLTVQGVSGSYNEKDRASIQNEINQRLAEINRIASQTQFNGIKVLGGDVNSISIQVGAYDGETIEIKLGDASVKTLGLNGFTLLDDGHNGPTSNPLAALDAAIDQVSGMRSHLGAIQNRFESVIRGNTSTAINLEAARSRIEDADYALEVSNMMRAQIKMHMAIAVLAQANQIPQMVLALLRNSFG